MGWAENRISLGLSPESVLPVRGKGGEGYIGPATRCEETGDFPDFDGSRPLILTWLHSRFLKMTWGHRRFLTSPCDMEILVTCDTSLSNF